MLLFSIFGYWKAGVIIYSDNLICDGLSRKSDMARRGLYYSVNFAIVGLTFPLKRIRDGAIKNNSFEPRLET
jgi:hypothetical protein